MTTENRFNLIYEAWIPIADHGLTSLRDVFSQQGYKALGGNPVQKIALTKLLLAIAQAAATPKDDEEWAALGSSGMAKRCLEYLEKWHDRFWLYGERPFLQMPDIVNLIGNRTKTNLSTASNNQKRQEVEASSLPKEFGSGFYPDLPSDNNTVLSQCQFNRNLSEPEKAVFIVTLMNFALGGKRVEKDLTNLSGTVYGSRHSAKSGPSLGNYVGYLHSFLTGNDLLTTIWMNLLSKQIIDLTKIWTSGLGIPPWEESPLTETCDSALRLRNSYMGCLLGMCRFIFLKNNGIYYLEGIQYPSHTEGWREPSITVNDVDTKPRVIWVDPNKRPWRELTSLLSFLGTNNQIGYDCKQISYGLQRARNANQDISIWSGGLKVRGNSGDQSVKQDDDFVESLVKLPTSELGENWFANFQQELAELEQLSKIVYSATLNYYKNQNMEGKNQAGQASHLYWQLCERKVQTLVNACADFRQAKNLRYTFGDYAKQAYDRYCARETARQLDAWAKNRPNLGHYLKDLAKTGASIA